MKRSEIVLPTTVIGSYSVPEWLEQEKTAFHQQRIGPDYLREIFETTIKAALKDQERAGIDIVSDGELRRDNDIDYLLERIPGVEIPRHVKTYYYDYYEALVRTPIRERDTAAALGFVEEFTFTSGETDRPVKFSFAGPFSLAKRIRNEGAYASNEELVFALARVLNAEAKRLVAAGARYLQIDEPFLAGYPEAARLAIRAINVVVESVEAHWSLHVCYGNRHARPSWEGHYDFLFPAVLDANIDALMLEFARKGYDDLELFRGRSLPFALGLGVIDVKDTNVEPVSVIERRVERALELIPAEKLVVSPDCGLRHLAPPIARAKLAAMADGVRAVRRRLLEGRPTPIGSAELAP